MAIDPVSIMLIAGAALGGFQLLKQRRSSNIPPSEASKRVETKTGMPAADLALSGDYIGAGSMLIDDPVFALTGVDSEAADEAAREQTQAFVPLVEAGRFDEQIVAHFPTQPTYRPRDYYQGSPLGFAKNAPLHYQKLVGTILSGAGISETRIAAGAVPMEAAIRDRYHDLYEAWSLSETGVKRIAEYRAAIQKRVDDYTQQIKLKQAELSRANNFPTILMLQAQIDKLIKQRASVRAAL